MVNLNQIITNYFSISGITIQQILGRGAIAIFLIIAGLFLGSLIGTGLKKLVSKLDLDKKIKNSFVNLFIGVIKISVYIFFITLALNQLQIPSLTNALISFLIVIPAFTAALIIITIGFEIAIFIKKVIEGSEIREHQILSEILFYFIIFISLIYSLKIALISINDETAHYLIIVLSTIISIIIGWLFIKGYTTKKEEN
ncbi:MAG: hypothetical protein ABIH25_02530 [Candidatus Woesearchaeota archaeon]